MQKILFPLFGLAALASTASAEPIPMTDDQLDLVAAGVKVTYNGRVYNVDQTNGVLAVVAEDGTLLVTPLSVPIRPGEFSAEAFQQAFEQALRSLNLSGH